MKRFLGPYAIMLVLFCLAKVCISQVPGDFKTKNTAGNWSDFNAWNVWDGVNWLPATPAQLPTKTTSVFIAAAHTILVDYEDAACNHLNVNGDATSKLGFSFATSILNVTGDINLFSAFQNCFGDWAAGAKIVFSGTGAQEFTNLSVNTSFKNLEVNKVTGSLNASGDMMVNDTLYLTAGSLNIAPGASINLNGAALVAAGGYLGGNSSGNLFINGTTGGEVLLPLAANFSIRNITISGTRILAMDGINDIILNGTLDIQGGSTYDNGGESQVKSGGSGAVIIISGTFINKDADNFTGLNGAIPGLDPQIMPGSTINFGLSGNQVITSRNDYQNISFSGSGIKASSSFTPTGTLTITESAILDASTHNIGDGMPGKTNFIMDGGRLILGTNGTQPMMNGLYNITGGVVEFACNNAGGQTIRSPKTYKSIEVTGNNVANSIGNITLAAGGLFAVKAGAKFTINAQQITGLTGIQTVELDSGAIFNCGNADGFSGGDGSSGKSTSLNSVLDIINISAGSTVNYSRATSGGDQIISNQLPYNNLMLSGTGNKIAPNGLLTITGNLTQAGTSIFVPDKGEVLFSGPAAQMYAGQIPLTFYNLTNLNESGLSINNDLTVARTLNLGVNSKINLASGNITLKSDAAYTARVAEVPASAIINYGTGLFIAERYFSAKRAWRFLSVPLHTLQTVKEAWQEGAASMVENPYPGYGTQVTGKTLPTAANGFDYYSGGGASIKQLDFKGDTWVDIAGTNMPLNTSGGLMAFIRGDRTVYSSRGNPTPTTLRTKGKLRRDTLGTLNVPAGKFTALGNPYVAALDMRKIILTNVDSTFYLWDPKLTGNGFGAYQTFTFLNDGFYPTPGFGSYGDPSQAYNYIQSGQAFFLRNSGALEGTVLFTESAKANAAGDAANDTLVFRRPYTPAQQSFRTTLYQLSQDTNAVLDGVLTLFGDNFSNVAGKEDAVKAINFSENLGIRNGDKLLSIEKRRSLAAHDTIPLNVSGLKMSNYRFIFDAKVSQPFLKAYLEDSYLKTRTPVDLHKPAVYDFHLTEDSSSWRPTRFRLLFNNAFVPLPVAHVAIKASEKNIPGTQAGSSIVVEWTVGNAGNVKEYVVEKSLDGRRFNFGGLYKAKENNLALTAYQWIDENAQAGPHYYRLKSIDVNGHFQYGKMVHITIVSGSPGILVMPNPVKGASLNIHFINQPGGRYTIRLLNEAGQVINSKQIEHAEVSSTEKIRLDRLPLPQIFYLQVIAPGNRKFTVNLQK